MSIIIFNLTKLNWTTWISDGRRSCEYIFTPFIDVDIYNTAIVTRLQLAIVIPHRNHIQTYRLLQTLTHTPYHKYSQLFCFSTILPVAPQKTRQPNRTMLFNNKKCFWRVLKLLGLRSCLITWGSLLISRTQTCSGKSCLLVSLSCWALYLSLPLVS